MILDLFNDLFVLELANNHWGSLERGLNIIEEFSRVIKKQKVKAAIKLQFRDVDTFIHKDFKSMTNYRYIAKTLATKISKDNLRTMVEAIKKEGLITMATPFDEDSVDFCQELDLDIIKIASSDINDWVLINKIVETGKPVIVSTGGTSLEDIQKIVSFFNVRNIPLAVNHCVAQYPTEKSNLDLSQIDLLKKMFPDNVIGFSTHECNEDIEDAIMIAYAKGARTFERHIDIENNEHPVSSYCSLPRDIERWISGYKQAVLMNGSYYLSRRNIPLSETTYLDALVRGVYAKRDLPAGHKVTFDDVYFAIPVQKGQVSCREFNMSEIVKHNIVKDAPITIADIEADYFTAENKVLIENRGL